LGYSPSKAQESIMTLFDEQRMVINKSPININIEGDQPILKMKRKKYMSKRSTRKNSPPKITPLSDNDNRKLPQNLSPEENVKA